LEKKTRFLPASAEEGIDEKQGSKAKGREKLSLRRKQRTLGTGIEERRTDEPTGEKSQRTEKSTNWRPSKGGSDLL